MSLSSVREEMNRRESKLQSTLNRSTNRSISTLAKTMCQLYFHKDLNLVICSHVVVVKGDCSVRATTILWMTRLNRIMNNLLFFFHPQVFKNLIFHQMNRKNSSSLVSLKKYLNKFWLLSRPSTRQKKTHCRLKFRSSKPSSRVWLRK